MLLLQHIQLSWDKGCRGAPYSASRNRLPKAYELSKTFFDRSSLGYPAHYIYLQQNEDGINEKINRIYTLTEYENVRVGATEILNQSDYYEVRYRYDFHSAIPSRQKYDPHDCIYKPLNELAMNLKPNEYGRIIYNGRFSSRDSYWYYILEIVNIFNSPANKTPLNIFTKNEPDIIYEQIEFLK